MKKEDLIYSASTLTSKVINKFKDPKSLDFKRILIIKLDEIGDMVTSLHVFSLLKQSFPSAHITVWCKSFNKVLLENDPHVDRIITDKKELEGKYDLHVDLRGNWDSILYSLTHPPKYRLDRASIRLKNKMKGGHPHEVFTNLQIIEPVLKKVPDAPVLKLYYTNVHLQKVKDFLSSNNITRFAVFHCGARRELRKWKPERFADLAIYLKEKYGMDTIFAGDKYDLDDIQYIRNLIPHQTFSVAGNFSLIEFGALTSLADLFVGNESGPMHIAAASGTNVVGLFGPGVPIVFYPYGEKSRYVHHVLDCNPCDQIHCVRPECPCIDLITVNEVKEKVEELLS